MADRSVLVRLRANADQFEREMMKARAAVAGLRDEIDTTNDRTAWLVQGLLAVGPALVPLGAAGIPVLMGIATQATVGAAAMATMGLAFNGVGDGLKALNEYQLKPTAENFEKLRVAMAKLGPDGAEFVRFLDETGDKLAVLGMDARAGMFPGMMEGIDRAMTLLPQVRSIVTDISSGIGRLSLEAGTGLAGPEFEDFFDYLDREAKPILMDMGRTAGNFIDGFASLIVAFDPLTTDFSDGMLDMSRSFEEWAENLAGSQGFTEFVDYVTKAGPMALDFFGAFVTALVELAEAAAPVGMILLPALTGILDALAQFADTSVGSLAIAALAVSSLIGRFEALRSITTGGAFGRLGDAMSKTASATRAGASAAAVALPTWRQWGRAALTVGSSTATLRKEIETLPRSMVRVSQEALWARQNIRQFGTALGQVARRAAPTAAGIGLIAFSMSDLDEQMGLTNTAMGGLAGLMLGGGALGVGLGLTAGFTLDVVAANKEFEQSIESVDEAIESSNIEVMREKLKSLNDELASQTEVNNLGDFFGQIKHGYEDIFSGDLGGEDKLNALDEAIGKVKTAIGQQEVEMARAARAADGYSGTVERAGLAAVEAAFGVKALTDAIKAQQDQARAATDAQFAWGQAVIDIRDLAKEGSTGINEFTKAGQDNYAALSSAGDAWNEMLKTGQATAADYPEFKKKFLDLAASLGVFGDEAKELARNLLDVPTRFSTEYAIEYDRADLEVAVAAYKSLPEDVQTYIKVNGIPESRREVLALVDDLKLTEKQRDALITLTDHASGPIQFILDKLRQIVDKHVTVTTTYVSEVIGGSSTVPQSPQNPSLDQLLQGGPDRDGHPREVPRRSPRGVNSEFSGTSTPRLETRGGSRPVAGVFGGSRQIVEVIVTGEMDLNRAKAQIHEVARNVSRSEIDQHQTWTGTQG